MRVRIVSATVAKSGSAEIASLVILYQLIISFDTAASFSEAFMGLYAKCFGHLLRQDEGDGLVMHVDEQ